MITGRMAFIGNQKSDGTETMELKQTEHNFVDHPGIFLRLLADDLRFLHSINKSSSRLIGKDHGALERDDE
jgi:hypothetical protein